jgi:hypothetical protein
MIAGINVPTTNLRHEPLRPSWDCLTCGDAWPCKVARHRMLDSYTTVALALTMAAYFTDACAELATGDVGELHRRFLGWVRDAEQPREPAFRPPTFG